MEFVKSFIYLNRIRFGDNLTVNIHDSKLIGDEDHIPPIAVQMLLENAFKHNVVSKDKPLEVNIWVNENELVVSNNINMKTEKESSSGVGLNNIKSRYGFLTDKKVEIVDSSETFEVMLPILKMKN